MSDEQSLADRLARLDDRELLAAVNDALATRQSTPPLTAQERDDELFYRSSYPRDDRRGPRVIRTPDED